ncbi:MAG: EamA family transporter [Bacteroidetes bacterium CG12_big_fil_rev_8_21_14_0_65_60_17]|nr:MAG: EamA family transporter [Bacteroidetes bacterium CG12_big_fil_rev_8_21_14_0_65_60_17]
MRTSVWSNPWTGYAERMTDTRPLHVYVVLGMGLLAISVSAILIRYGSEAPGEVLAVWRTVSASIMLGIPALFGPRSRNEMASFSPREWFLVATSGVFLGLHFVLWISSLYYTSIASASVLVSLSPIFMGIIGYVVLRERLRRIEVFGIFIAIAGTVLLQVVDSGHGSDVATNPVLGNLLALSAAFMVSIYLLIGRVVRQNRSWLAYVAPVYGFTALTTLVVALLRGVPLLGWPLYIYALCVAMAVVPQLMGHGALNYAIRWFPAATLGVASLLEPIGASTLGWLFFSEIPALAAVGIMLVILGAVVLVLWPRRRPAGT